MVITIEKNINSVSNNVTSLFGPSKQTCWEERNCDKRPVVLCEKETEESRTRQEKTGDSRAVLRLFPGGRHSGLFEDYVPFLRLETEVGYYCYNIVQDLNGESVRQTKGVDGN